MNYKHGEDFNYYKEADEMHSDKYNQYRERFYETYWDTKDSHEYYSKPTSERAWLQMKKVISFYMDLVVVWGFLALVFTIYNANTTS